MCHLADLAGRQFRRRKRCFSPVLVSGFYLLHLLTACRFGFSLSYQQDVFITPENSNMLEKSGSSHIPTVRILQKSV